MNTYSRISCVWRLGFDSKTGRQYIYISTRKRWLVSVSHNNTMTAVALEPLLV